MKKLYTFIAVLLISVGSQAQVVISQVYGGGGNGGATYSNDFIELFNSGSTGQNLSGWSVQYASAAGTTWATTALPNFMLMPGKYFLIQQAVGATPVLALPTPDLDGLSAATTGTNGLPQLTGIAMSGSNGKVILVNTTVAETTVNPTGSQIIDKVGFGATPAGFEGTGPTGTALTSSTAVLRKNGGCTDTNSNPNDFETLTPAPRNNATPANTNCNPQSTNQNQISGLKVFVSNNSLNITSDSNELKSVSVYNILGKQVINTTTYGNPINVSNINAGVYIVKVTEEGKTATRKLVIQ